MNNPEASLEEFFRLKKRLPKRHIISTLFLTLKPNLTSGDHKPKNREGTH